MSLGNRNHHPLVGPQQLARHVIARHVLRDFLRPSAARNAPFTTLGTLDATRPTQKPNNAAFGYANVLISADRVVASSPKGSAW